MCATRPRCWRCSKRCARSLADGDGPGPRPQGRPRLSGRRLHRHRPRGGRRMVERRPLDVEGATEFVVRLILGGLPALPQASRPRTTPWRSIRPRADVHAPGALLGLPQADAARRWPAAGWSTRAAGPSIRACSIWPAQAREARRRCRASRRPRRAPAAPRACAEVTGEPEPGVRIETSDRAGRRGADRRAAPTALPTRTRPRR